MTRITTNGPDHYDPRPMTSWQRDHRDGPLQPPHKGEPWYISLALWLVMVLAFVLAAVAFA